MGWGLRVKASGRTCMHGGGISRAVVFLLKFGVAIIPLAVVCVRVLSPHLDSRELLLYSTPFGMCGRIGRVCSHREKVKMFRIILSHSIAPRMQASLRIARVLGTSGWTVSKQKKPQRQPHKNYLGHTIAPSAQLFFVRNTCVDCSPHKQRTLGLATPVLRGTSSLVVDALDKMESTVSEALSARTAKYGLSFLISVRNWASPTPPKLLRTFESTCSRNKTKRSETVKSNEYRYYSKRRSVRLTPPPPPCASLLQSRPLGSEGRGSKIRTTSTIDNRQALNETGYSTTVRNSNAISIGIWQSSFLLSRLSTPQLSKSSVKRFPWIHRCRLEQ